MKNIQTGKLLRKAARYEKSGDPSKALELAEHALSLSPDTNPLRMYVARLMKDCGRHQDAYHHYRHLLQVGTTDLNLHYCLVEMLGLQADRASDPAIESEILDCLAFDNIEFNMLARVAAARLVHKYNLLRTTDLPPLDTLCVDTFLLRTLERIYFTNRELELMLRKTRRALLLELTASGSLRGDRLPLILAIGRQCANNQYVYACDSQEEEILETFLQLQTALTSGEKPSVGLLGAVLAPAMYMPVAETAIADKLSILSLDEWPEIARPLVKSTLLDRYVEKELAADMPSLTPVVDEVSRMVKAQYEAHPYPRWLTVSHKAPVSCREDIQARFPGIKQLEFLDEPDLDVLVAGCGTGRQPISIAKSFRNIRITAVDLSNMSLAYAVRMAAELDIDNIEFRQGDILELAHLDKRFGIIYCSGVLHHMDDPIAGWRVLCDMTLPGGLMNIGLYSELARAAIVDARTIIAKAGIDNDPTSIRSFRRDILDGKYGGRLEPLVRIGDFFSLSGCRDLIFNVQEHRFTLPRIDEIRRELDLEFLGLDKVQPVVRAAYRKAFPDDPGLADPLNWHTLEQKNPGLFLGMYNLWFRKVE